MELGWALLIWLVLAILVFIIARHYRIRTWSGIVLSLVIATIVLGIISPPNQLALNAGQMNGWQGLYWLIMFVVPLVVLIYVISKAVTDRTPANDVAVANGATLARSRSATPSRAPVTRV